MSMSACMLIGLSVCLSASISRKPYETSNLPCMFLWPLLGAPLVALRYLMNFRFSGLRHVCT